MLRRLLHLAEVRELEQQLAASRANTNTVIREQNEYIEKVREDHAAAERNAGVWRDAAVRIARELGATIPTARDASPGGVITAALQRLHARQGIAIRFTDWLRDRLDMARDAKRTDTGDYIAGRVDALSETLSQLEDMLKGIP